jgi:hypothetical protein
MMSALIAMGNIKDDLAPLAPRINEASNNLNTHLESIERRLNDLNLGVEAWISYPTLTSSRVVTSDAERPTTVNRQLESDELGYGRHGNTWALLVRTICYTQTRDPRSGEWEYVDDAQEEVQRTPLLRSRRHLRVAAVDVLPKLIDEIKQQANAVIEAVERARQIAASLE